MTKIHLATLALAFAAFTALQAQERPSTRMPETTTTGFSSVLSENTPIGETQRPEWTSARRFTTTRVYIQKEPWEVGIGSWWRLKHKRDGSISHRLLEEVEIGLPYRMQLDIYNDIEGDQDGRFHYHGLDVELRWAVADWGKIWGNPTLYGEYKFNDPHWGPDVYEFKLLLGDEFAQRWHWGVNFVWEAETGGERQHEFQVAGGLSHTLIDRRLGIGVEFLYAHSTVRGGRGDPEHQFNIGPSVQWRVTDRMHIDLSCMFGTNQESTHQTGFFIVGYDFGPGGHAEKSGGTGKSITPAGGRSDHYVPVSGRQN